MILVRRRLLVLLPQTRTKLGICATGGGFWLRCPLVWQRGSDHEE